MNPRFAQQELATLLAQFPAVVLLGPRQAGKTTLALTETERRGDALYLDLELPSAQPAVLNSKSDVARERGKAVIARELAQE